MVPCTPKGCEFDSRSGHVAGLQVRSLVQVCTGGSRSILLSHVHISLPLSPYVSLKSMHISSAEDKKIHKNKTLPRTTFSYCFFVA